MGDCKSAASSAPIVFASSNNVWGGSEELWSRTALHMARAGHLVEVFKPRFQPDDAPIRKLREAGVRTTDLTGPHAIPRKVRVLGSAIWKFSRAQMEWQLARAFKRRRPRLVVISQGINSDGWYMGIVCRRLGIPYVFISQKASDLYWPFDSHRREVVDAYRDARSALFVSDHNRRLTEEQIGLSLPRAAIVRNPFNASLETAPYDWPDGKGGIRLACVARLDVREKGQDLLLRVLARQKWRERPVTIDFYGQGHNECGLRAMAAYLDLRSAVFAGHVEDPGAIWADHHALVLASRCEGLPLSMFEAMLHARPVIVTDVGGNREAVREGQTGFLAGAATEDAIDDAMERAWAARETWEDLGRNGLELARLMIPEDPVESLSKLLLSFAEA